MSAFVEGEDRSLLVVVWPDGWDGALVLAELDERLRAWGLVAPVHVARVTVWKRRERPPSMPTGRPRAHLPPGC